MSEKLNKTQLRRSILKQRRSLSPDVWQQKSSQLCDRLKSLTLFQEAKVILAYFSFRQEPDLLPLFNDCPRKWGFPRCVGKSLHWHFWQPGDILKLNSFGIQEPLATAPKIAPETVDLILVPAVAIDSFGYRLGYGGGFYDRLLASPQWQHQTTLGIVFNLSYLSRLPAEPWDRKLNYLCTESQERRF